MARILIIDDNESFRRVIRRVLEFEGYLAEDVEDSDSGFRLHEKEPFDIIITDLIMPEKEGISTIMEIKEKYPDVKIIAVSGGGKFEPWGYLDMAKRIGAHRTLAKPFSNQELIDAIKELLESEEME